MNETPASTADQVSSPIRIRVGVLLVFIGIPIFCIGLIFLDQVWPPINPRSRWELQNFNEVIKKFREQNKNLPSSISELRTFARSRGDFFSPYDRYGQRISLILLSEKSYLIQSFGRDNQSKKDLQDNSDFLIHGVDDLHLGVKERNFADSLSSLYQPAFLEGLQNAQGTLSARLFINKEQKTRILLVSSPKNRDWISTNNHDRVSEFLWLKSGHELIFSAEQSERYDAGLFYWNLFTGEQKNLWPTFQSKFWPSLADDQEFYLALSHISMDPPLIYFQTVPRLSNSLNPKEFFGFSNLYALTLDENIMERAEFHKIHTDLKYSIFDYPLHQAQWTSNLKNARPIQKKWAALPLKDDPDSVLTSWQDFGAQQTIGPMTPYQLWWLASLYNDSYRYLIPRKREDARVIRNFGVEIAEALEQMPIAPKYLQAMGTHLKKSLLLSKPADYNVSHWTPVP